MGYKCLKYLLQENYAPKAIVIPYEENEGSKIFKSIKLLSEKHNLNLFRYKKRDSDIELYNFIKKQNPDFGFSCYYSHIIDKEILKLFKYKVFNIHGGLLPNYRGALSSVWSIINREESTGATIHYINEKIDMGDIIEKKTCQILNEDTGYSLYEKVEKLSLELFIKYSNLVINGQINFDTFSQNQEEGKYYTRKIPNEGIISWNENSSYIYNFCRALYFPGFIPAQTILYKKKIKVYSVIETNQKSIKAPGTIINYKDKELEVCSNDKNIIIKDHDLKINEIDSIRNMVLR